MWAISNRLNIKLFSVVFILSQLCLSGSVNAVDKSTVREKWHTPYDLYLSPQEAYDMKTGDPENVIFLDVRTQAEAQFVGFSDVADANIPIYKLTEEWKPKKDGIHGSYRKRYNTDFIKAIENFMTMKGKDKSVPIILMCQSGGRAPVAVRRMHDEGYEKVYFQVEGFEGNKAKQGPDKGKRVVNGWKKAGLPWSYNLKTEKMYFNFVPEQK